MNLCNETGIRQSAKPTNNHEFKIIGECVHLIDTTSNPITYFSKYNLLLETLGHLSDLEQLRTNSPLYSDNHSSTQQLKKMQDLMEENTNHFLRRTYIKVLNDMNKLKTKQGRIKKFNKYLNSLEPYLDDFTPENMKLLADIKNDFQKLKYSW